MPRTEAANQQIRQVQRTKILEAARRVFAHKGRAATMADVAASANVSQGLAYRYFANKEAILHELVQQALQADPLAIQRLLERPGTPGERLDMLVSEIVEARRAHPELYQFVYQVLIDEMMPNDLRELVGKQGQIYRDVMRQLIIEGQTTGEVADDDPDQLLAAVVACLEGLWRGMALLDPQEIQKHFPDARIILRMLKPHSDR